MCCLREVESTSTGAHRYDLCPEILGLVSVNIVYLFYAKGHIFLVVSAFDLAVCACMLVG
jgi:hypothetical protein